MTPLSRWWRHIPESLRYALILWAITRLALAVVGVSTRLFLSPQLGLEYHTHWVFSDYLWLDIWGIWDSWWYLDIIANGYSMTPVAETGYTAGQTNIAFFPFYPLLARGLSVIVRDAYISGLLVSNFSLIVASTALYHLVERNDGREMARRAVKYLFLFPTAFQFSSVLTEATYVALFILCFLCADRRRWVLAGVVGGFLAMTRTLGVLVAAPLFFDYMKDRRFDIRKIRPDVLAFALPGVGLGLFMLYCYYLSGDFFAFKTAMTTWGRESVNPFSAIYNGLLSADMSVTFTAAYTLAFVVMLIPLFFTLRFSYWIVAFYSIFVGLSTGLLCMPRIILVAFPFYILWARWGANRHLDVAMTCGLAALQLVLMVAWVCGFELVV